MTMNARPTCFKANGPVLPAMMILGVALAGCGAPPADPASPGASRASVAANADEATPAAQPGELLTGTWSYVPSVSCGANPIGTVNGNDLSFPSGAYCTTGNGIPFDGFTFEQPVDVEAGGTYDLTLTLSNFNGWLGFIPTQLTASIAGVSRSAQATSASVIDLTFPIDTLPPGPTTVRFTVRPPAAGVGPVNGGIFLTEEGCNVHLSLQRTN
jgi:hypothetical protein